MTTKIMRMRVAKVLVACAAVQVLAAGPAAAADGEVISNSSDSAGNVFQSGDYARFNFNNIGDCPTGISSCWVETQWRWKGDQWYSTWNESSWIRLPAGQDYSMYRACGRHKYEVRSRLAFMSSTTKTVEFRGNYEKTTEAEGSAYVTKLLGKFMFNRTDGYGFSGQTLIETKTSTNTTSSSNTIATSMNGFVTTKC